MRIWLIILFFFCSLITKAQVYGFPIPIADGGKPNILVNKGTYGTLTGFTFLNSFSDTAAANVPDYIRNQPGIMILVAGSQIWIRNQAATAWVQVSGGGGGGFTTANNGLTASTATNIQWGGRLIQNTSVSGAGLYNITFDSTKKYTIWGEGHVSSLTVDFTSAASTTGMVRLDGQNLNETGFMYVGNDIAGVRNKVQNTYNGGASSAYAGYDAIMNKNPTGSVTTTLFSAGSGTTVLGAESGGVITDGSALTMWLQSSGYFSVSKFLGAEWMRITKDARMGIGTSSPNQRLSVAGSLSTTDSVLHPNLVRLTDTTGFDVALLDRSTGNMKKMYPNVFGSFASTNIYNSDGSLTGDRTLDLNNHILSFSQGGNFLLQVHPADGAVYIETPAGRIIQATDDNSRVRLFNDASNYIDITGSGINYVSSLHTLTGYVIADGGFTASYPSNATASKSYLETANQGGTHYAGLFSTDGGSNQTIVKSFPDSIFLYSSTGYFRFYDLLSTIDTTTYKPAVFDINGKMRRGNSWAQFSASSGTVTSVATGLGLSGGTITTTGTIIADTTYLETKSTQQVISANKIFSGSPFFTALTASRVVFTDANKQFTSSAASSVLLNSLTDPTGTGVAVFGTTPTFTTSIIDPLVIGSTSANGTLTLEGNNNSSGNTSTSNNIVFKVGNSAATTAAAFINTGAFVIGAPTADANQAVVIQSLTNTASDGVKIYALNNTASMKLGYQTILTSGALVLNPSSTGAEIAAPSGTGLSISTTAIAPTSTLTVDGSFGVKYVAKTTTYTITATDFTIDATSGTFTATLPTAVGITGRCYFATNSGSGVLTLATASSQTFANQSGTPTTITINQFGGVMIQSNGANWIVLSKF